MTQSAGLHQSNQPVAPKQALKILFISDVYYPRVNGVSTSIHTFVQQLQQQGHTVDLIAPDYDGAQEDQAWVKRVPSRKVFFDPEDRLMKLRQALALLPSLKAAGYDLVHIHTPFVAHYLGKRIAKHLNIPCVETYHTFFEDYLHHYLPWVPTTVAKLMARFVSKKQCNAVDAIVSPSKPMLDVLRNYGVQTYAEVVPTGLEVSSFVEQDFAFKAEFGIDPNRPLLLYVGRVAFEKNIDFLLGVVDVLKADIPDLLLLVTGEGPALKPLQAKADSLGISDNVMFVGYLDRYEALNACYRAADVFVFASTSETQGLVVLEAMAQATPVVAIAELGTASVLVEGEGAMIALEDTFDFAQKVQLLLNDKPKRLALGRSALAYVKQKWTAEYQAKKMQGFYQAVLSQHSLASTKAVKAEVVKPKVQY